MRQVCEVAVETGLAPSVLLELDSSWLATIVDVLKERNG